jgi:phosphate transport system substrate-binding protein
MKRSGIKISIAAIAIVIAGSIMVGCGNGGNNAGAGGGGKTITISGSTSVGPLMEKEAAAYMEKNNNIKIEIQQIGSSAGIKNAIDGVSEVGMSSRDLKEEEKATVKYEAICFDGIGVIVHPSNGVTDLSMTQLKEIYTGKIKNWKEVGGVDSPIVVVSREEGSGTRDAFQEIVGFKAEEMITEAQISQGNGAVKTIVTTNENAIGYVSFEVMIKDGAADPAIKALKVDSVEPTPDNVIAKTYKVSRPFIVAFKEDKLTAEGRAFIDFIKGEEGQKIAKDNGAIPLK